MKRVVLILVCGFAVCYSFAQEDVAVNRVIEKIYDQLMESSDSEIDFEDLYYDLSAFYEHPINLNHTTPEELAKLHFLSNQQIENLTYYLYRNGPMRTVYELQLVDGYDVFSIQFLVPFVQIGSSENSDDRWNLKTLMRDSRHELIARFDGTFEQKIGYQPISDDELAQYPNRRYLGDPYYTSLKYRLRSSDKLQFGFTAEKDAGEQFWGQNNKGYDSYSAFLQINNLWKFATIVMGDYRANFGQGLVIQQNMMNGKSSYVTNVATNEQGLKRHASTDEYNFMRGVGATAAWANFKISAFYSYRKLDADSSGGSFSSFKTDGLHRTISDYDTKRTVAQQVLGANMSYRYRFFRIGITSVYTWLNIPIQYTPQPYQTYYFQGKSQMGMSVDYLFSWRGFQFFGETAITGKGALATINGLSFAPISRLNLVLLQRYYAKDFDLFFSKSFGESSHTTNESGLYLGAEIKPVRNWKIAMYGDLFKAPWLSFEANKPSSGYDVFLQLDYMANRKTQMYVRLNYKQKEKNVPLLSTTASTGVFPVAKTAIRYCLTYEVFQVGFKNIIEWNAVEIGGNSPSWGFLIMQDVVYKIPRTRLTLSLRYTFFDAPAYENRFYTYERDVPYAAFSPALYGVGNRWYLNLDYEVIQGLTLFFRIAQTYYMDGRTSIGSGTEMIETNHRTDFRLHLQWKI